MNNGGLPTSSTAKGRVDGERATVSCTEAVRSTVGPSENSPDKRQVGVPKKKSLSRTRAAHVVARRRVVIGVIARVICRGVIGLW